MNETDKVKIEELIKLLKLMKLRPASGYGFTNIEWREGEIFAILKKESFKAKYIKP